MKPIYYVVSILLITFVSMACQPSHKKQNTHSYATLLDKESQITFEMPPNIPNMDIGSLQRGVNRYWNLVSFPVETTQNIQSFLENQDYANQIQSVWSWDASLGESGAWRVFPQTDDFEILENISPDNGYWIRARNSFEFSGTGVSENLYNFSVGWNLIGVSHSQTDINIEDFFTQGDFWKDSCGTGSTYDSVWSWQDNTWKVHFAEAGKLEEFNHQQGTSFEELFTLESGMGVWMRTLRNNVPPTQGEDCNQSDDDHGNAANTATPLSLNVPIDGNIEVAGDIDIFSFTTSLSGNYLLQSTGSTDTQVHVYNTSLEQIAYNDDGGAGYNFKVLQTFEADQIYYFRVSHVNSNGTGEYKIALIRNEDDHGNEAAFSTPVYVGNDVQGKIETFNDDDFFSMTANFSTFYVFESTGNIDVVIRLYDSALNAIGTDDGSGQNHNFKLDILLEEGATYFFKVYGRQIGNYSVSVKHVMDEHSNSIDGATSITQSEPLSTLLNTTDDIDYFSFTPSSSEGYIFLTTAEIDTFVTLYDSEGNELVQGEENESNKNIYIPYTLQADQTYFLKVFGNSQSQGKYTVAVVPQDNSHFEGFWHNADYYEYHSISNNKVILCSDGGYWLSSSLVGNFLFSNGIFYGEQLSIKNNDLVVSINGDEHAYSPVSTVHTICEDFNNQFFANPPNYQGFWYNEDLSRYFHIDENNKVLDCSNPQNDGSFDHSLAGNLVDNILFFGENQFLLSLTNDVLTTTDQYLESLNYQEVSSVPSVCESFFEEN